MKPGDTVKWKSRAGGAWKEKIGTVVAIVPAGKSARTFQIPQRKAISSLIRMFRMQSTVFWFR